MLRWHREDCPGPLAELREYSVDCLACGANCSHASDPAGSYPVFPAPIVEGRSCLNLTWPSSVEYSEECVVESGREDLSRALIDYLGAAPYNEHTNTQQDEKSKLGFPSLPSDHHIRVLHLSPSRGRDQPLHGFLEVQDLNAGPYYEALSYTWTDDTGDATLSGRLYVGAEWDVLPITKSCSDALRRLRLEHAERSIWVDSVCINQLSNVEKTNQTALMRTIYARSVRCVVDLGAPSSDSDAAIDYANAGEDDESLSHASRLLKYKALANLFSRRYFSRVWIIQEIVSAPHVKVNCGNRSVDLRLLLDSPVTSVTLDWMQGFKDAIATGKPTSAYDGPIGLLHLLWDTVDSKSTDPRDKIFALLGLVRGLDLEGITADYNLTYAQVYTGLAAYFIRNHGLTKIIMLRAPHEDKNLPSWVPNWGALLEYRWTEFDGSIQDNALLKTAKSVLVRRKGHERLRPVIQTAKLPEEQFYWPEIHRQTGVLIHTASHLFSFQDPSVTRQSSTLYTKVISQTSEHNSLQYVIVTLEPVKESMDTIACFLGQKSYVHLRKTFPFTYQILGEAMVFLHELSEEPILSHLPDLRDKEIRIKSFDLFTDFVTLWCEQVSIASELWQMYIDPTGSGGIRARFDSERRIPCMFYYRDSTIEEVHRSYVSLKNEAGDVATVLRQWIGGDGQMPVPPAVRDLIECILYWQESRYWETLDASLLPIPRTVVDDHTVAWVNANIIRQRWLAVEKILAERHEMERTRSTSLRRRSSITDPLSIMHAPFEDIVEIWRDLTGNLILRLNIIAEATGSEPFLAPDEAQAQKQTDEFDKVSEQFLNSIFISIIYQLDDMHRVHTCRPSTYHDRVKVSLSPTEWLGTPEPNEDPLRSPGSNGRRSASGSCRGSLLEDVADPECAICVDLLTRYDAVKWKENWKLPKSRSDIKTTVKAFGITTYGDRRRTTLEREPGSLRTAQVLGNLLNLSIKALKQQNTFII